MESSKENRWGAWSIDPKHEVLAITKPEHPTLDWYVPLNKLKTKEEVYGWIDHVEEKTWITAEDLGNFVRAAYAILADR